MAIQFRDWQNQAIKSLILSKEDGNVDFLVAVAPAAGKTFYGCGAFKELVDRFGFKKIVIVSPTANVRDGWQEDITRFCFQVKTGPHYVYDRDYSEYQGISVTYSWMHNNASYLAHYCDDKTLVILDEVHHCGDDESWGLSCKNSFEGAGLVLCLSGTPWRTGGNSIPFIEYDKAGYAIPDYSYTIAQAVSDKVCQKPEFDFANISGSVMIRGEGYEISSFQEAKELGGDIENKFYNACIDDERVFVEMFSRANQKLDDIRGARWGDAGGMIIAKNIQTAEKYAGWLLVNFGLDAELVHSETKNVHKKINSFKNSTEKWLISVDMIGEGTNIPRLQVELYMHNKKAPICLYQYWMRAARVRGRESETLEHCHIFALPHSELLEVAKKIESEIKVKLKEKADKISRSELGSLGRAAFDDPMLGKVAFNGNDVMCGGIEYNHDEVAQAMPTYRKLGGTKTISEICDVLRAYKEAGEEIEKEQKTPVPLQDQKKIIKNKINAIVRRKALDIALRQGKAKPSGDHFRGVWSTLYSRSGVFSKIETATFQDLNSMLDCAVEIYGGGDDE